MRRLTTALVILLAVAPAGCGAATSTGLPPATAGRMRAQLASVKTDAARGRRGPALRALSEFASLVTSSRRAGRLTPAQAAALRTGIARTRRSILAATAPATSSTTTAAATTPATTTTTATVTSTAPAPAPPKPGKHPGHGGHGPPGHGHGHGHGGGGKD